MPIGLWLSWFESGRGRELRKARMLKGERDGKILRRCYSDHRKNNSHRSVQEKIASVVQLEVVTFLK